MTLLPPFKEYKKLQCVRQNDPTQHHKTTKMAEVWGNQKALAVLGSVSLKSGKPDVHPNGKDLCYPFAKSFGVHDANLSAVDLNYLATEVDKYVFREGLRQLTKFKLEPKFSENIVGESVLDGLPAEPLALDDSDEKLDNRIAMAGVTTWNPSGTCSIGKVVDTEFRVKRVEGLRVIDTSVIPVSLSAHFQAPIYALSEQAAEIITGNA
ncbi:Choline dehydrogenase [Fusarium austroafricanum]|uniref:Choline dehydrogenase n=1 Tax=Fusarium austroafricanum TaxID=2364996 RepID=A0A8H4KA08_9HYPO|nr:Choline dehydrogenase [Fusarium austroafricanum]